MVSTYHGIETGRRAVEYFRKGMELSEINTSKIKEEGYSRQVVNVGAGLAYAGVDISGHLGTGVQIASIQRVRNQFLDQQYRNASVDMGYWTQIVSSMKKMEGLLTNSSGQNLNNRLNSFWTAMQDVHVRPEEDAAMRAIKVQSADSITSFMAELKRTFNNHRTELNQEIGMKVQEANTLIDQIGVLNGAIQTVRLAGGEPNALLDKRDLLADSLCRLTGATVGLEGTDDRDGDYRIDLHGKLLVQGTNLRHLVCVENPGNNGYYDVQVEYNQYDIISDPNVAQVLIERRADDHLAASGSCSIDGTHELEALRLADELFWTVGYGTGISEGGDRLDNILEKTQGLGILGSFALQVGSSGVRTVSNAFASAPPGMDVVLGPPGPGEATDYRFRVASGDFESTITLTWDALNSKWDCADNLGNVESGTGGTFTNQDLSLFINKYTGNGVTARVENHSLVVESVDRHMVSITDMKGDLMSRSGLVGGNPAVLIEVEESDSLQTIANKINNAYRFSDLQTPNTGTIPSYTTNPPGSAPSTPESWLHATVEQDESGAYYLCLTSNVAGEEARINVMAGSVCGVGSGEMYVPRLLGLIQDDSATKTDVTSYIQLDTKNEKIITKTDGDVFVDDAWIRFDGKEYLSSSNEFKEARRISLTGNAPAKTEEEFSGGIRLNLQGEGSATIIVRHPLQNGEIYAMLKCRDDIALDEMDFFDDLVYRLGTEFNALHYAGYGAGDNAERTGVAFFNPMTSKYGSFGTLNMDDAVRKDPSLIAAACGDGSGKSRGAGDGGNALMIAQLQKRKLFMGNTADFSTYYQSFVAELGAFKARASETEELQGYLLEQITFQRTSVMGVDPNEELMNIVRWNQEFNMAGQYLSKLFAVIDQIISGVGRVGQ